MSILQRICQCGLVDQSTSSAIDNAHSTLCFLQTCSIEKMSRFWRERCVQRNEIGSCKQIVQFFDELDLQTSRARRGEIWIVSNHAHPERNRAPAQVAPDPTHADNAERFVVKLDTFEIFSIPFPAPDGCIGLRNLSRYAEQKRKGMLGGRNGVPPRRIEHNDTASCRRFNIDIVHANTGPPNHAKAWTSLQNIRGHFRLAAHNKRAELGDDLE